MTEKVPKFSPKKKHAAAKTTAGESTRDTSGLSLGRRVVYGAGFSLWVMASFALAQLAILGILWAASSIGLTLPAGLNEAVLQTVVSVVVYVCTLLIVIGVPWRVFGWKISLRDMGLEQTLPRWRDLGLAPAFFVLSLVATGLVMYLISAVLPGVDLEAEQQVGFENLTQRYEMLLAFFTLVILAPICEELLFRGYLYSQLRRFCNTYWTVAVSSVVFGAMHLYAGPDMPLQWNVFIGTAVLAVFIGSLRAITGSVWAGILVHMLKNGVAFFILFVAPILGMTLVQ